MSPNLLALRDRLAPITLPPSHPRSRFSNWGRAFACTPSSVFLPTEEEQIPWILQLAQLEGRNVRAVASGHSPSDLPCTSGFMIRTDKLDRLIKVNTEKCTITVQGGMSLKSINNHLDAHGLAVSNLGSISEQSICGCISTATHGTGFQFPSISSQVIEFEMYLANGQRVRCSRNRGEGETNERLFLATLCGLGTTGIVVRVTLSVERAFRLREVRELVSYEEAFEGANPELFGANLVEAMGSAEHVRMWWYPQSNRVCVSRSDRTYEPVPLQAMTLSPLGKLGDWFWETFLGHNALQFAYFLGRYWPNVNYYAGLFYSGPVFFTRSFGSFSPSFFKRDSKPSSSSTLLPTPLQPLLPPSPSRTESGSNNHHPIVTLLDVSHKIFNVDCLFPQYTVEWSVPLSNASSCLRDIRTWLDEEHRSPKGLRPHFPIEVRCSDEDDIWLSPAHGRKTCWIGIMVYKPYALPMKHKELFTHFSNIMRAHGGRPHWAKTHDFGPLDFHELYPMFGEFLKVVNEVDPNGLFRNEYVRRHLFGEHDEETGCAVFRADV